MERPEGSLEALHPLGCPAAQDPTVGRRIVPDQGRLLKVGYVHVEVDMKHKKTNDSKI